MRIWAANHRLFWGLFGGVFLFFGSTLSNHSRADHSTLPQITWAENTQNLQPVPATRSLQITWSGADLSTLVSMDILHVSEIEILPTAMGNPLMINLDLSVTSDQPDRVFSQFKTAIINVSHLAGNSPAVVIPTPLPTSGLNVGKMRILVPPAHRLIDFTLKKWTKSAVISGLTLANLLIAPQNGMIQISQVTANISLIGGTPDSQVVISRQGRSSQVRGDLTANLDAIKSLTLTEILGRVLIKLKTPAGASVNLDGNPITQFPYSRPAK